MPPRHHPPATAILLLLVLASSLCGATRAADIAVPPPDQPCRLENQAAGNCIHIGYLWYKKGSQRMDAATCSGFSSTPTSGGFRWKLVPDGTGDLHIVNDERYSNNYENKNADAYLTAPDQAGQAVIVAKTAAAGKAASWRLRKALIAGQRNVGFCTIQNVKTGLVLTALKTKGQDDAVALEPERSGDRTQYWSIQPIALAPITCLTVPQGGWDTKALNRCAVLTVPQPVEKPIPFTLSGPGATLRGEALYWGRFWNDQHFYILNINHPELRKPGTWTLAAHGHTTTVRIVDQAYIRPYRQNGADRFSIGDLFDPAWGFIGHWGRLHVRFPKGLAHMPKKTRGWIDESDSNKNKSTSTWEEFMPPIPITEEEGRKALLGGWEMTDYNWHTYLCDGNMLLTLAGLHEELTDAAAKRAVLDEIAYGATGLLANQEPNGSWRQRTVDWTYWVGSTAAIGAGLAAIHPVLRERDPALAAQVLAAATRAWAHVHANRFDRTKWAIKGEGVLPDGSILADWPQSHRVAYTPAYLSFAIEMARISPDQIYRTEVDDILTRGDFDTGSIRSRTGAKFPGEQDKHNQTPLSALLRYVRIASPAIKDRIRDICRKTYQGSLIKTEGLGGPYGTDGRRLFGDYSGGQWRLPNELLVSCQLYDAFGDEFSQGLHLAQRKLDWWYGSNPFATSLIFGVGDRFLLAGWASYHALGRHVGLQPRPSTYRLRATEADYGGTETDAAGGATLWRAIALLQRLSDKPVPCVELYGRPGFGSAQTRLTTGTFERADLIAHGMDPKAIVSLRIPPGHVVEAFDQDRCQGTRTTFNADIRDLTTQAWGGRIVSLQVRRAR